MWFSGSDFIEHTFFFLILVKSNTAKENVELRTIIKHIWPRTNEKLLNKVVPKPDCKYPLLPLHGFLVLNYIGPVRSTMIWCPWSFLFQIHSPCNRILDPFFHHWYQTGVQDVSRNPILWSNAMILALF